VSALPTPTPPPSPEAQPYWDGLAAGRLVLPKCDACGHLVWYPRSWCPVCQGDTVSWIELSGRGVVYACTIVRKAPGDWGAAAPYVVAYVELAEGPRVLTNVETDDPDAVVIGTPVVVRFVPVPGGDRTLLRFAVDDG